MRTTLYAARLHPTLSRAASSLPRDTQLMLMLTLTLATASSSSSFMLTFMLTWTWTRGHRYPRLGKSFTKYLLMMTIFWQALNIVLLTVLDTQVESEDLKYVYLKNRGSHTSLCRGGVVSLCRCLAVSLSHPLSVILSPHSVNVRTGIGGAPPTRWCTPPLPATPSSTHAHHRTTRTMHWLARPLSRVVSLYIGGQLTLTRFALISLALAPCVREKAHHNAKALLAGILIILLTCAIPNDVIAFEGTTTPRHCCRAFSSWPSSS